MYNRVHKSLATECTTLLPIHTHTHTHTHTLSHTHTTVDLLWQSILGQEHLSRGMTVCGTIGMRTEDSGTITSTCTRQRHV